MLAARENGVIVHSGLAPPPPSTPQVPPQPGPLPPLIHDFSLDLLGGHDRKECCGREGGETQGDSADHGSQILHLLAELGGVQRAASGHQRSPPYPHTEGDFDLIGQ